MTDCQYAKMAESGKPRCAHPGMVLYVGLYCDPAVCQRVKKGEIKAI